MITIKTTAKNTSFTRLSIHNGQILNNLTMHIPLLCSFSFPLYLAHRCIWATRDYQKQNIHNHKPPTRELQSESNDLKKKFHLYFYKTFVLWISESYVCEFARVRCTFIHLFAFYLYSLFTSVSVFYFGTGFLAQKIIRASDKIECGVDDLFNLFIISACMCVCVRFIHGQCGCVSVCSGHFMSLRLCCCDVLFCMLFFCFFFLFAKMVCMRWRCCC